MKKLILMVGMVLILLLGMSTGALATTANDCTSCHNPQALDFEVTAMDRTANCKTCHGSASHATWRDPVTGRTKYAVNVTGVGYFKSAATISTPSVYLHVYHSGNNTYSARSDCNMCHGVSYCISCHNNTINHQQHGSSAFAPVTFSQADGTLLQAQSLSCASAQCHQEMPNVIKTKTDGNQLCVNCHPRFGYSAKDSTGHLQTAIDSRHAAPAAATLVVGSVPQSVTCTGCHSSNLDTEHATQGKDCLVCHNPSLPIPASVKSVVLNAQGVQNNRACTQCHFNSSIIIGPSEHPQYHIANLSNNLSLVGGPHTNCDTCHNTATPLSISTTVDGMVYKKSISELASMPTKIYSCLGCHNTDNNLAPKHRALLDGQERELTELHAGCNTCHTPGTDFAAKVLTIAANLKNGNTSYECSECHSGPIDTPTVSSTDPGNNATNVPINKHIAITFSKPVQAGTNINGITLTNGVTPVSYTYGINGNVLTLIPSANLEYSVSYSVYLPSGAVSDLAGNVMAASTSFGFTTGSAPDTTAPTVISTDPADNAADVPINKQIAITFNEPVQAGADFDGITVKNGATVIGYTYSISGNVLTLKPTANLNGSVNYTVNIPVGSVNDLAGNPLAAGYSFGFTTRENKYIYDYDELKRLKSVTGPDGTIIYQYDNTGNLILVQIQS